MPDETLESLLATDSVPTPDNQDKGNNATDVESLQQKYNELESSYKTLQSDYSKKSDKAKKYDELIVKSDNVISGKSSPSSLSPAQMEDLKYFHSLGVVTDERMEAIFAKKIEELEQKFEAKLNEKDNESFKKQRLNALENEISTLSKDYDFISPKELKEFMAEEAKKYNSSRGTEGVVYSSATKAARDLYFDKFLVSKIKPNKLPQFESENKSRIAEPMPKVFELDSREWRQSMVEQIRSQK